jgi:hypothetical protein
MPIRRKGPRNDLSATVNAIGTGKVPVIKKRYPRMAQANFDSRNNDARYTNVDSRYGSINSMGWCDQ